jgi:hypothetical protein
MRKILARNVLVLMIAGPSFVHGQGSLQNRANTNNQPPTAGENALWEKLALKCPINATPCRTSLGTAIRVHDSGEIEESSSQMIVIVDTQERRFNSLEHEIFSLGTSTRSDSFPTQRHGRVQAREVFIGLQAGSNSSGSNRDVVAFRTVTPIYEALESEFAAAQLNGLAKYVSSVKSTLALDLAAGVQDFSRSVIGQTRAMFSKLRATSGVLAVSPVLVSLPYGATFGLQTQDDIAKGSFTVSVVINQRTKLFNVYRGIYQYTVSFASYTTRIGTLNLIDVPGTLISCRLSDNPVNREMACEAQ